MFTRLFVWEEDPELGVEGWMAKVPAPNRVFPYASVEGFFAAQEGRFVMHDALEHFDWKGTFRVRVHGVRGADLWQGRGWVGRQ